VNCFARGEPLSLRNLLWLYYQFVGPHVSSHSASERPLIDG
jgi:hypothetical protein